MFTKKIVSIRCAYRSSILCLMVIAFLSTATSVRGDDDDSAANLIEEQLRFFETKIRPVLVKECYSCHSQTGMDKAGLFVDTRQGLLVGGESGPAIVPGNLEDSLLWNAINYEDYAMPPRNPLSEEEIADFGKWILMGAPDPRAAKEAEYKGTITSKDIERGRKFWSFVKPEKSDVPQPMADHWPHSDIDRFVAVSLEEASLTPNQDADPLTILRRLCFDLNGLPPTLEQTAWFENAYRKDPLRAIEHVVDALLEKPQFGERWARHWLDVVRYAESAGKEFNTTFPHAWRYRDYVIDSFNADKPYDQFVQEQVAGDLLPVKTDEQWQENLIATGFLAIGPKSLVEQNRLKFRMDVIDEQIDVTTRALLGVSVACARCHDHKFDPIPQAAYYALAGIFMNTDTYFGGVESQQNRNESGLIELPIEDPIDPDVKIDRKEFAELKQRLEEKEADLRDAQRLRILAFRSPAEVGDAKAAENAVRNFNRLTAEVGMLRTRLKFVDDSGKPLTYCMGVQPADSYRDARLLIDGEVDQPGQNVPRGFVQVMSSVGLSEIDAKSSGRLELARWMTSPDHPLTARVMVNRIWQHLLGEGIVRSTEDFAITGEKPDHPELLDYLSVRFMDSNWSVKTMVREIATSRVYRLASQSRADAFEQDPDNRLLWRSNPRRLEAEVLRDAMLATSGTIDLERPRASLVAFAGPMRYDGQGGEIVKRFNMSDNAMMQGGNNGRRQMFARNREQVMQRVKDAAKDRGQEGRLKLNEVTVEATKTYRSVYLPVLRDGLPRSLELFDAPAPSMVVGHRDTSDTATQALYMMNNPFVIEQSEAFAKRVMKEQRGTSNQIQRAFQLAYGRDATREELKIANQFFGGSVSSGSDQQLMAQFCQALLASAEFRYLN